MISVMTVLETLSVAVDINGFFDMMKLGIEPSNNRPILTRIKTGL